MTRMRRSRRGSALLATLATVAVLATITAMASRGARASSAIVVNARADATARAMAESGVLATVDRIERALTAVDSTARAEAFDGLLQSLGDGPFLSDSLGDGVFATTLVNVSARFDVNSGDSEGLTRLFSAATSPSQAAGAAARISARLGQNADPARARRDSIAAAFLGRDVAASASGRFESLDEVAAFIGVDAAWLSKVAEYLTVDGDGFIDRRHAPAAVLRAASGSLVDAPTRLLIISRGWERDVSLTREIQAVYAVAGDKLTLVRWREQTR